MRHIFIYGPPGSGKTTIGKVLAADLELPFIDLDADVESAAGRTIKEIMKAEGETAFRNLETAALKDAVQRSASVIALGGGALLRPENRASAEVGGEIIFLEAGLSTLMDHLTNGPAKRPLLEGDLELKLKALLEKRAEHYNSFPLRIAINGCSPEHVSRRIQQLLGRFHIPTGQGGYEVLVRRGGLRSVGDLCQQYNLNGPIAVVADSNVAPLYAKVVVDSLEKADLSGQCITIPAGETHKTLETISLLWKEFLEAGLDRKSTVIALGGGVTGDLAGFAASTFMRGINWVGIPTSLLAMVDSSIGGKTGFDLPYGKNLVGSFHSPRLVLADSDLLTTLPQDEFRSGMGEVIKHGIISDVDLFEQCARGEKYVKEHLEEILPGAIAVKIQHIRIDPFEQGIRAALNLGHTVGHAVELASGFQIRHGEAVAIGMVVEARLAERLLLAETGLALTISTALTGSGFAERNTHSSTTGGDLKIDESR